MKLHARVRMTSEHVIVDSSTLPRFAIALCEPMLGRVYQQRHDRAYAGDPDAIVIRLQVHGEPVRLLGPFVHEEGMAIATAIELARGTVLLAWPGFSVRVSDDQTQLRVAFGGWDMPIPTAVLVEARCAREMPEVERSIPTGIPLDASTRVVEFAFLGGTAWALGPLPAAEASVLVAELARWRASRPIDHQPIPVDAAELFANPTRWHGRRVSVVAPWEYGLERSWFGPAWLEVPPHAPVSEGSYRVRAIGTWIFPRVDGDGYGHMGCSPGELQAESIEILEAFGRPKRDGLTGLLVKAAAGSELERVRGQAPVAVAMLDLDHFKRFNDTHGHQVGDEVLRAFAAAMTSTLRSTDIIIRWRADELVAIMPATPIEQARVDLERARIAIAAISPGLTASIGLVTLADGESSSALYQRLDQTLYTAQRQGRDRIVG